MPKERRQFWYTVEIKKCWMTKDGEGKEYVDSLSDYIQRVETLDRQAVINAVNVRKGGSATMTVRSVKELKESKKP